MKKPRYLLSAAVAILLLGLPFSATPQFQNRIEVLQVPGERHHFAVHLLRIINTVEAERHIKQGSYVSWDVLRTTADFSPLLDRKSTRLNSSHVAISYAVFCLKKKFDIH